MKIINTYIVYLDSIYDVTDEYVKLHEMENGNFMVEYWNGRIKPFDTDFALKLIKDS